MTSLPTHAENSTACFDQFRAIGETYGRLIFQKCVMFDLPVEELQAGVDFAVADLRGYLVAGGACEKDIDIACLQVRLAIIEEGRRLTALIPEMLETLQ